MGRILDRATEPAGRAGPGWAKPGERAVPLLASGGLLGALLASSRCLSPVAPVSLGLGGARLGLWATLAPFQPVFVVLATTSLVGGFWLAYRPAAVSAPDGSCASPRSRRLARILLRAASGLSIAAIAFEPIVLPLLFGRGG